MVIYELSFANCNGNQIVLFWKALQSPFGNIHPNFIIFMVFMDFIINYF